MGNVRVVYKKGTYGNTVLQSNSYYPFGMAHQKPTSDTNPYLYNGKEFVDDLDLNWHDYGARFYDAQIGRWHSVDPLSEKYYSWSPYNYTYNNPLIYTDPNGATIDPVNEESAIMTQNAINSHFSDYSYTDEDGNEVSLASNFSYTKTENGGYTFKSTGWEKIDGDIGRIAEQNNLSKEQVADLKAMATGLYNSITTNTKIGVERIEGEGTNFVTIVGDNELLASIYTEGKSLSNTANSGFDISDVVMHEIIGEAFSTSYYRKPGFSMPIGGMDVDALQISNLSRRIRNIDGWIYKHTGISLNPKELSNKQLANQIPEPCLKPGKFNTYE